MKILTLLIIIATGLITAAAVQVHGMPMWLRYVTAAGCIGTGFTVLVATLWIRERLLGAN